MLPSAKNLTLSLVAVCVMTCHASASFASDLVRQSETGFSGIVNMETYDGNIYIAGFKDCDNGVCKPTIRKQTVSGDLIWEREPTSLLDYEWPSMNVNDNGVLLAAGTRVVSYSHQGVEQWALEVDFTDLPSDVYYFWVNNIVADEHGIYASLTSLKDARNDLSLDYLGIGYDGEIEWVSSAEGDGLVEWDETNSFSVKDGQLYSGVDGALIKLTTNGEFVERIEYNENLLLKKIVPIDGALYAYGDMNRDQSPLDMYSKLYKFNLDGDMEWSTTYYPEPAFSSDLHPRISDIIAVDNELMVSGMTYENGDEFILKVTQYTAEGEMLLEQKADFSERRHAHTQLAHYDGSYFVTTASDSSDKFDISEFSFNGSVPTPVVEEKSAAVVKSLGDINGDGAQDLAVLIESAETDVLDLMSIGVESDLASITFGSGQSLLDIKVVPDLNANGASEIAVVAADQASVQLLDSLAGETLNELVYDANLAPIKVSTLVDINNNGAPEIALLGSFKNKNSKAVFVKDSITGELLASVYFNPYFDPTDFSFVEDIDGDTLPEVAVLGTNSSNTSKFEIRSLQGKLIKNIWLGKSYNSTQLLTLPVVENEEPALATALGALQTKVNGNGLAIRMMDAASGEEIQAVSYNWRFSPITAVALPDTNSNGTPEVAVLGTKTDSATGESATKIEVKDSYSGNLVKNIWQYKTVTPIDLTVVPDVNGNGNKETVTLVERNDTYQLIVNDSKTGELLYTINVALD